MEGNILNKEFFLKQLKAIQNSEICFDVIPAVAPIEQILYVAHPELILVIIFRIWLKLLKCVLPYL